jgi:lysyl endopeptidase
MKRSCLYTLIVSILIGYSQGLHAFDNAKPLPPGIRYQLKAKPSVVELPPIDSIKLGICEGCSQKVGLKSLPFSSNFDVSYNPQNSGIWQNLPDGRKLWAFDVHSNGAFALNFVFANLSLLKGEEVYVYNPDNPLDFEQITNKDNTSNIFVTMPKAGENLRIEYLIPGKVSETEANIQIVKISHAFRDIFGLLNSGFGTSAYCNVDVNCPEAANWQKEKHSVVKLIITKYGVNDFCTGVLLNNTANDGKPYLLTAQHCIETYSQAGGTIFYFDYESPSCHGPNGNEKKTLRGSTIRAVCEPIDFTFVELDNKPPTSYYPYFAGWNVSDQIDDTVVTIHHPMEDVKKISFSFSQPTRGTFVGGSHPYLTDGFWIVENWDIATTQQGSSGSPLFDKKHLVVGTLSGGSLSSCVNPTNDYFENISKAWNYFADYSSQLKHWLDPLNINNSSIDGFDPYVNYCDTFSNIPANVTPVLLPYDKGDGYWSGHNSDSIKSFAEAYYFQDTLSVNGLYLNIARNFSSTGDSLKIFILDNNSSAKTELFSEKVVLKNLGPGLAFIDIYPTIKVIGGFLVGYTIPYANLDTFAVYNAPKLQGNLNTAYVLWNDQWRGVNEISSGNYGTSFDMRLLLCNDGPLTTTKQSNKLSEILLHPNPATSRINIRLPFNNNSKIKFEIYNFSGKLEYAGEIEPKDQEIAVSTLNWPEGLYLVRLLSNKMIYVGKFLVTK